MYVKNQNFLVIGVSKSGYATAEYLIKNGGNCCFVEEKNNVKITDNVKSLIEMGAKTRK